MDKPWSEQMNDVFTKHGLVTIPVNAKDWRPTLLLNIKALSELCSIDLKAGADDK